jgi:F-type H+-transporting ATPase subunit gamma
VEQLPRLAARIESLEELRDLIRALRALAASRVQEAQGALQGIRAQVAIVEEAIAEGACLLPGDGGGAAAHDAGVLLVVCSEHGFVGGFNDRLLDRAEAERDGARDPGHALAVIGRRGGQAAEERGLDVAWCVPMATHVDGVLGVTRRVADRLAGVSRARVIYGAYRRGGQFEITAADILPLDPALLARAAGRSPPLHHLAPDLLLRRLAEEYLFAEITRAAMESLASENGARLRVMEAANHNIADKLDDLRRREHSLRQEVITEELLDVVTGAEAILQRPQ